MGAADGSSGRKAVVAEAAAVATGSGDSDGRSDGKNGTSNSTDVTPVAPPTPPAPFPPFPVVLPWKTANCGARRLQPNQEVLVQFTDGVPNFGGVCMEILMRVGECWGMDSNQKTYDCQGRCGPGCHEEDVCSNWSENCLRHDVCSWYYAALGGATDANCGGEFSDAVGDYANLCIFNWDCRFSYFNTYSQRTLEAPQATNGWKPL